MAKVRDVADICKLERNSESPRLVKMQSRGKLPQMGGWNKSQLQNCTQNYSQSCTPSHQELLVLWSLYFLWEGGDCEIHLGKSSLKNGYIFFFFFFLKWALETDGELLLFWKIHQCGWAPFWTMADKWAVVVSAPVRYLSCLWRSVEALSMKWVPHYPGYCSRNQSYYQCPCFILHSSATIRGEVRK